MVHRVGYAPGVYDLFHIGHLNILRHARSQCDYLVAGVVSDEMAALAKGHKPVIPLPERLEIVRSVRYVDAAFVETVPDKVETWQQVRFDVIFKGDDWRDTEKGKRLEARLRRGRRGGGLLPVHRAHVQHPAAPGAGHARQSAARSAFSSLNHLARNATRNSACTTASTAYPMRNAVRSPSSRNTRQNTP